MRIDPRNSKPGFTTKCQQNLDFQMSDFTGFQFLDLIGKKSVNNKSCFLICAILEILVVARQKMIARGNMMFGATSCL